MRPAKTQIRLGGFSLGIRPVWSVFTVLSKGSLRPKLSSDGQRRLWSDWADAQADLSLRWAHTPFCWFCHEAAHIFHSMWEVLPILWGDCSYSFGKLVALCHGFYPFYLQIGPTFLFSFSFYHLLALDSHIISYKMDEHNTETKHLCWKTTKPTKWPVCRAKTHISLGICPVWSESLLSA